MDIPIFFVIARDDENYLRTPHTSSRMLECSDDLDPKACVERVCQKWRTALARCEQATSGRCAASSRACDVHRERLQACKASLQTLIQATTSTSSKQPAPPPSAPPPVPPTKELIRSMLTKQDEPRCSVDSNGRSYVLSMDGEVLVDDSLTQRLLPPAPELPRLRGPPACGRAHCVAVDAALGMALSWATAPEGGRFGQLGWAQGTRSESARVPLYKARPVEMPASAGEVMTVAAGDAHTALVDSHGGLWLCGCDRCVIHPAHGKAHMAVQVYMCILCADGHSSDRTCCGPRAVSGSVLPR